MKKNKKIVFGIILCVIGVIGLFGVLTDTSDKAMLASGSSILIIAGGVLLILGRKAASANAKEQKDIHEKAEAAKANNDYYTFRVAGVTFNNGRKTRQAILRKIKYGDEPFDGIVSWDLKKYDFEGSTAVGIYANSEQVGNVPKDSLSFVLENWNRIKSVYHTEILGGGETEDGEKINYGCEVTLCLSK